jgi:two-component system chemotaxis response regulator CheY
MRVLIADDQKTVGTTLAALVTQCGHDVVEVVSSGLEAIQAYSRHQPDVVLMDYWMPRLNGATACRNILARDPNAKIILVSGAALTPEITESGAIAILSKPVSLEPLYGALYTAGSPRRERAKPAPSDEVPPDAELPREASPDEAPRPEADSAGDGELLN